MTKAIIGKPAPAFSGTAVLNGEFKELKLSDYLGTCLAFCVNFPSCSSNTEDSPTGKYLVFFFYPLDFTFVCPTEILAFNDRVEEFRKLGAEVRAS